MKTGWIDGIKIEVKPYSGMWSITATKDLGMVVRVLGQRFAETEEEATRRYFEMLEYWGQHSCEV